MNLDPSSRADAVSWLRLTLVPGVSLKAQRALLASFGSPHEVVRAPHNRIAPVAGPEAAEALARGAEGSLVDATLRWLEQPGNHLVTLGDPAYPAQLLEIADPPTVLYVRGRLELLASPSLAIVGSRNATAQGVRDAQSFATALSQAGLCIVSGLAAGIDAAAHRGGLAGAASSVAVMGTGPETLYPHTNRALGEELAARGCLVTEFPHGTPPLPGNFPRRNRLISGLSQGVLVVEAALRSGSLITARRALDQGRDVFAIPGSIHSPLTKGCHELIRQGAKLVESAQDVLAELRGRMPAAADSPDNAAQDVLAELRGRMPAAADSPDNAAQDVKPDVEEDPVLAAMGFGPISMERIAQLTGMRASSLAAGISRLELQGRIAALAGGLFQRVKNPVIE